MKTTQRLKQTILIASFFALYQAVIVTAMRPLFHEPIDYRYWHSLVSFQHLIVEIPLCLLFGWNYPAMIRRAADRKALAASRNQVQTNPDLHITTGATMTKALENAEGKRVDVFARTTRSCESISGSAQAEEKVNVAYRRRS